MEKKFHTLAIPVHLKERLDDVKKELQSRTDLMSINISNSNVIEYLIGFFERNKDDYRG